MRFRSICVAAVAFALMGSIAEADFILTSSSTTGTFNGVTKDFWTFQIQNDGRGATSGTSKLLAVDLTLRAFRSSASFNAGTPDGHLYIHTFDLDGAGVNDDADFEELGSTGGSFIRFGSATSWTHVSSTPPQNLPCPPGVTCPNQPPPYTDGQSFAQFEIAGASNLVGGGTLDATPKTIAVGVVDPGELVQLCGEVGAESGPPFMLNCVPESAGFAFLLGGLGVLISRRRRV